MPRVMKPLTQSNFLVTVDGVGEGVFWETFTGIDEQSQTVDYSNGFSRDLLKLVGPSSLQPVTLTRGYDPERDADIIAFWQTSRGTLRNQTPRTISVQPIEYTPEPVALGPPFILFDFRATQFVIGAVDKTSQELSRITLAGVVTQWTQRGQVQPVTV